MEVLKFVELPVTTWNGSYHEGVSHSFNLSEIKEIKPNGRHVQTILKFKDGHEELISLYYDDVMEIVKE